MTNINDKHDYDYKETRFAIPLAYKNLQHSIQHSKFNNSVLVLVPVPVPGLAIGLNHASHDFINRNRVTTGLCVPFQVPDTTYFNHFHLYLFILIN